MLHPHARTLLKLIDEKGLPPLHALSPVEAREAYRARRTYTQPDPPAVALTRDLSADGIPLRLYRPAGSVDSATLPVLVYYHGGGWVIGDLDTHDTLCRQLCNASGCAVVAVDYRLGPESPYPAAADDAAAAVRWVRANAASLQLDAGRMAVGGDSAGGNLAAVTALDARDRADLALRYQLLIYPATDQRLTAPSIEANGQGYLLTRDTMHYFRGHYLPDRARDTEWRASPLLHTHHGGLPPALVLIAGYDPLRDEGLAYAQKLTEAGVTTTLINFERQIHGFITMGRVIDEANAAVQICAAELRRALA